MIEAVILEEGLQWFPLHFRALCIYLCNHIHFFDLQTLTLFSSGQCVLEVKDYIDLSLTATQGTSVMYQL